VGKINKEWHQENKMPKNPTREERLIWHKEHLKHCECRPVTTKLRKELDEFFARNNNP